MINQSNNYKVIKKMYDTDKIKDSRLFTYTYEEKLLNSLIENEYYDEIKKINWSNDVKKVNISKNTKIKHNPNFFLPNSIKEICFDNGFNDEIDSLKNLENADIIYFLNYFNQPLDNVKFSDKLKYVYFSSDYRQPLHNVKLNPNALYSFGYVGEFNLNAINNLPNIKYVYINSLLSDLKNHQITMPVTLKMLCINIYNNNQYLINNIKVPFGCKIHIIEENKWSESDFDNYLYCLENNLLD